MTNIDAIKFSEAVVESAVARGDRVTVLLSVALVPLMRQYSAAVEKLCVEGKMEEICASPEALVCASAKTLEEFIDEAYAMAADAWELFAMLGITTLLNGVKQTETKRSYPELEAFARRYAMAHCPEILGADA